MTVKWLTTRKGKDVLYDDETKKIIDKKSIYEIAKLADIIHEEYIMTSEEIKERLGL